MTSSGPPSWAISTDPAADVLFVLTRASRNVTPLAGTVVDVQYDRCATASIGATRESIWRIVPPAGSMTRPKVRCRRAAPVAFGHRSAGGDHRRRRCDAPQEQPNDRARTRHDSSVAAHLSAPVARLRLTPRGQRGMKGPHLHMETRSDGLRSA